MKRTLLFVTLFSFVAISTFLVARNIKSRIPLSNKETEGENEGKTEDRDGFEAAAAYLSKLRANQVTGSIDPNDYYKAMSDADYNLHHPASRGDLNLQWDEMGPDNVGGRTRAILYDKQNPGWVFAGAASGGLWYSKTNGSSWNKVPGFDSFGSLTVSCLAQGEDGSIYFGTGEQFAFTPGVTDINAGDEFPGRGIWKSSDHGQTWTQIQSIAQAKGVVTSDAWSFINHLTSGGTAYPDRMYAAINGSSAVKGIQYWDGTKWNTPVGLPNGKSTGFDVEVGSNGVVYAIVGNKYYRSTNGINFSAPAGGIPGTGGSNRIELSVSTVDPNYVYAISSYLAQNSALGEIQGVFKSTDAGVTWTTIAPEGIAGSSNWEPVTQGAYALAITAWPGDKNVVFIGGIDCYKGIPNANSSQGYDWFKISNWVLDPTSSSYIHADIHRFVFDPTNPNNMFIGSDGGISYTTNAQSTYPTFGVRNHQYNVTQFYGCAAKPYTGEVLAGAQDNGNIYIDFNGNTVQSGRLVKGGDGGDVALSYLNPQAMFAEYVDGTVQRSSNNGLTFSNFFDFNIDCLPKNSAGNCSGDGQPDEGAVFAAPILLWENQITDSSEFFLGTNSSIWMTRQALNFAVVPQWFRLGSSSKGAFLCLSTSADGSVVYGGTAGTGSSPPFTSGIYRITGLNSTKIKYVNGVFNPDSAGVKTRLIKTFANQVVTGVSVDAKNPNHVVCTLGNYGNTDFVYESFDAEDTTPVFTSIQGSGLPQMPVYSVLIDPNNSNNIIIGTELGVFTTSNGDQGHVNNVQWTEDNIGLNRVPILKLRAVPLGGQDNVIYASAYGRGVFRTSTLSFTGVNNVQPATVKGVNVYPNPASNEVFASLILPLTGSPVELNIFDIAGRRIKTINEGKMGPGSQLIKIPTSDLTNGTYLLNIRTESGQTNSKFIILK